MIPIGIEAHLDAARAVWCQMAALEAPYSSISSHANREVGPTRPQSRPLATKPLRSQQPQHQSLAVSLLPAVFRAWPGLRERACMVALRYL